MHTTQLQTAPLLAESDLAGAAVLTIVGLVVVFCTLVVLALVITGIGRLLGNTGAHGALPTPAPAPARGDDTIDPHHLVVISAAVAAAAGPRARVHRIVMLGRQSGRQWVTEGRVVVMGSHRLH